MVISWKNELKVNEGEVLATAEIVEDLLVHTYILNLGKQRANSYQPNTIRKYMLRSRNPQIQSFYLYKGFGEKEKEFLL